MNLRGDVVEFVRRIIGQLVDRAWRETESWRRRACALQPGEGEQVIERTVLQHQNEQMVYPRHVRRPSPCLPHMVTRCESTARYLTAINIGKQRSSRETGLPLKPPAPAGRMPTPFDRVRRDPRHSTVSPSSTVSYRRSPRVRRGTSADFTGQDLRGHQVRAPPGITRNQT